MTLTREQRERLIKAVESLGTHGRVIVDVAGGRIDLIVEKRERLQHCEQLVTHGGKV